MSEPSKQTVLSMEPSKKSTYIIAAAAFVILAAAIYFLFIFQKGADKIKSQETIGEVKNVSELIGLLR